MASWRAPRVVALRSQPCGRSLVSVARNANVTPTIELDKEAVLAVLRQVQDPDLHQDIVTLGFVTQAAVCDGVVKVTITP